MKNELGGKTMTKFSVVGPKTHDNLPDNNYENKKAKDTKKCVIKRKPKSTWKRNKAPRNK